MSDTEIPRHPRKDLFDISADVIYLDGNSLEPSPKKRWAACLQNDFSGMGHAFDQGVECCRVEISNRLGFGD